MLQKLFTFLIVLCLIGAINLSYSGGNGPVQVVINGDVFRSGNGPFIPYNGPPAVMDNSPLMGPFVNSTGDNLLSTVVMTELSISARSTYDLNSNGVTHWTWQEPINPLNIHACFMTATDPTYTDRNCRYFYSSNGGANWNYLGTIGATRSGFPGLSCTPDGRAVLTMHNTDGGGVQRGQMYVDLSSGAGAFTTLDPGLSQPALGNIWAVNSATNTKAFMVGSQNGVDSVEVNTTTNLTAAAFTGWKVIKAADGSPAGTAQQYSTSIGTGKWGVAFLGKDNSVYLTESTNEGGIWGTPITIRAYNTADTTGALRSIDLTYEGANARVVFGLGKVLAGGYFPGLPSQMMFWGPDINGGQPVQIDQAPGLNGSNPQADVFFSCCRGTIGKSNDGSAIYCAYNKARQDTASTGNNFFDTYLSYSLNHGATWSAGIQCTNLSGQGILADYRWASISPNNAPGMAIITVQRDTVPGSNVNSAPPSICRDMFIKVTNIVGIHNIGGEVPKSFALQQNYPNPFNPSTKIRFALPTTGFVSIKLYDVLGKEVAVLVNENLTAGVKEVDYNAVNLPSGVYFYTIKTGSFVDTKKMVLTK